VTGHHHECILEAQRGFDHVKGAPTLSWRWLCHEDCEERDDQPEQEAGNPDPADPMEQGRKVGFVVDRDLGDETEQKS
jgi:hypothetical protein